MIKKYRPLMSQAEEGGDMKDTNLSMGNLNLNEEKKVEKHDSPDRFQLFLYDDVAKLFVKHFPEENLSLNLRVVNALTLNFVHARVPENQIIIEFDNSGMRAWDIMTLTARVAYQLITGRSPANPLTRRPYTISTIAVLAMAYVLLDHDSMATTSPTNLDQLVSQFPNSHKELLIALSNPRPFFTKQLCMWREKLHVVHERDTNEEGQQYYVCAGHKLKDFVTSDIYWRNLESEIIVLHNAGLARDDISQMWSIDLESAMDPYWDMKDLKTRMLDEVHAVMEWLGLNVVANILCPGASLYNRSENMYELTSLEDNREAQLALVSCTLALVIAYCRHIRFEFEDLTKNLLYPISLAAVILAYKALGLDDTAGCIPSVSISGLVQACPFEKPCVIEEVEQIERIMYKLSNQTPCREQFAAYRSKNA